jgi:PPK2 family polyphosphate:nucleotide phosphotransferase
MFQAVDSRYLVPFDASFKIGKAATSPPDGSPDKATLEAELAQKIARLSELQDILYAHDQRSLLLIFQAMDAAGKDGTMRAVLSGVNPAGCQVFSFKAPSAEELDHDFLWRTARSLPERGRIGVFNRSYYEEVLIVRVHPEYLEGQNLPQHDNLEKVWRERFESIREHERHLARNGMVILKFFLNVSKDEQRDRFLKRLDEPEKNWKFNSGDVKERQHWDDYMVAYQDALNETSRPWAPWYAIPADNKRFMRLKVADIIVKTLESLDLHYPRITAAEKARFDEMRALLQAE